jgi:hemerythrin superfamily protein
MVEHAALRLRFRSMKETQNFNSIYSIEEFVRSCHAKVEDEVVFPALRDILEGQGKQQIIGDVLKRLEADHKLIDSIGDQVRLRTIEGDSQLLAKRILLYCSTVETHNTAEETQLFSYWKELENVKERTMNIIKSYGMNRYYEMTGISEELFKLYSG